MVDQNTMELAAAAAGLTLLGKDQNQWMVRNQDGEVYPWNPDKNLGDALWLSITLRINLEYIGPRNTVTEISAQPKGRGDCGQFQPMGSDDQASTCLAIVLAAAEIQRTRKPAN